MTCSDSPGFSSFFCYSYPFKPFVCWESCWAVEALKVFGSLLYILTCKLFDSSHLKTQRFNQDSTFNKDVYFTMKRHRCPLSVWLFLTLILQSQFVTIVEKQEQIGWQLQKGIIKLRPLMSLAPSSVAPATREWKNNALLKKHSFITLTGQLF